MNMKEGSDMFNVLTMENVLEDKITIEELERLPEMKGQKSLPTPFNTRCRNGSACDNLSRDRNAKYTFSLKGPGLET